MTWQPPNISGLSDRLASQNRRVEGYLEGVLGRLDRLIDAALARDWEGVRHWSLEITRSSEVREEDDVRLSADRVLEAAHQATDDVELKRRVMTLIAACGKARRRRTMP